MSVTVDSKTDGVTVFTVTSDSRSACPPLCQILKNLCCSPVCCSVSQHLSRVQSTSQSVLGALHIMVGLLNIAFGVVFAEDAFPFWLGAVFILFGITSIVSEKYPSPCLVFLNVFLNLSGVGFALAAIVLYSINIVVKQLWWMCEDDFYRPDHSTPSPYESIMMEKCLEAKSMALILVRSINSILVLLSVLELCLAISSAVLGIKALRNRDKNENKSTDDTEAYNPLPEEVTTPPTA